MIVREADLEDLTQIVEMSKRFYSTTSNTDEFDNDSVYLMAKHCIEQGISLVLAENDRLAGFLCGLICPLITNHNIKVFSELAWYIYPESREGSSGIRLISTAEAKAKEKGCQYCCMASLYETAKTPEKIYKSRGYKQKETVFVKVL